MGLQSFTEVAEALTTIREKRLYKSQYTSFQQYCDKRWHFNREWADRLILAAGMVNQSLPDAGVTPENIAILKDSSANTVLALRKVNPKKVNNVVGDSVRSANGKPITPSIVKKEVARVTHKPLPRTQPPPRRVDETHPILTAMEAWFQKQQPLWAYGQPQTPRFVFESLMQVVRKAVQHD